MTGFLDCSSYGSDYTNIKTREETYEAESCPWDPASDIVCTDNTLSRKASNLRK